MSTINKQEIQKFSKLADEWWGMLMANSNLCICLIL